MAYAELEDDVNGTVNGIDKSAKGEFVIKTHVTYRTKLNFITVK